MDSSPIDAELFFASETIVNPLNFTYRTVSWYPITMSIAHLTKKSDLQRTKVGILDSAAELFSEKGYTATSMADIASTVDISKAAIYHHFENKEALFTELLSSVLRDMDAVIVGLGTKILTNEQKVHLIRSLALVFLDHRNVIRLLRDLSQGSPIKLSKATMMRSRLVEDLLAGPKPSKEAELRAHCALVLLMSGINPPRLMSATAVKKFNIDQFTQIVAGTLGIDS